MSDQEFIFAPPTVTVEFAIPTVDLIMNSMHLLLQVDDSDGFGEWVRRTAETLTDERIHTHRLVFNTLIMGAEFDDPQPMSFPEYLDRIETEPAQAIQQRLLDAYQKKFAHYGMQIDINTVMEDETTFLAAVDDTFGEKYRAKGMDWDLGCHRDAYPIMQDADQLKAVILEHMRTMWDKHMRDEWYRSLPTLEECVAAFKQLDFSGLTTVEAIRSVTRRDLTQYFPDLEQASQLVFVPSAHIGPYNSYFERDNRTYVVFGARTPEGVISKSPALDRSELLVHLNALADDTRLKILELLTRTEELCAQDIITTLNLSQSSASRHLRQLTATGYLTERRRDVAKCYTLNIKRIDETTAALKHFLRSR